MSHRPTPAPNYTNAFLVTSAGILFMAFFTLAALGGILWVAIAAVAVHAGIRWLDRRREARHCPAPAAPPRR
ncbi:hypothetical protein [Roseisalinus antarcticus]|uniref:Uncharacterized protein n=1 Tax=Roseisalinus antarcticus TaxID=254357 RepID=A0A1Y5SWT2_9RHOB|nr:hypothetical protein [Roseisalinus antarcticus]SLN46893.1 hypothetical protein ROA7023_01949 [Roseisalinus antarcticus]